MGSLGRHGGDPSRRALGVPDLVERHAVVGQVAAHRHRSVGQHDGHPGVGVAGDAPGAGRSGVAGDRAAVEGDHVGPDRRDGEPGVDRVAGELGVGAVQVADEALGLGPLAVGVVAVLLRGLERGQPAAYDSAATCSTYAR